jgi:hypothetical protein
MYQQPFLAILRPPGTPAGGEPSLDSLESTAGGCDHGAMRKFILAIIVSSCPVPAFGWSESGHHLVALLAFDHLSPDEQRQLLETLAAHPRYAEDFTPPPMVRSADWF